MTRPVQLADPRPQRIFPGRALPKPQQPVLWIIAVPLGIIALVQLSSVAFLSLGSLSSDTIDPNDSCGSPGPLAGKVRRFFTCMGTLGWEVERSEFPAGRSGRSVEILGETEPDFRTFDQDLANCLPGAGGADLALATRFRRGLGLQAGRLIATTENTPSGRGDEPGAESGELRGRSKPAAQPGSGRTPSGCPPRT